MSVFVHRNVGTVYLTAIILGNLNDCWQTICPQTGKNTKNTIDQCYSAFYLCQRFSHIFFFTNVDWCFTNILETLLSFVLRWTSQKFKLFSRRSHVISKKEKWHPHKFTTLTLKYLGLESIKKVTISNGNSSAIYTVLNITGRKMDLLTFALGRYVAKMQQMRGKSGPKIVNATFASRFTTPCFWYANVAFNIFASELLLTCLRRICKKKICANLFFVLERFGNSLSDGLEFQREAP